METTTAPRDGSKDFDFNFGQWNVRNRRLRTLFCSSDDWYEFDAQVTSRPVWDGKGNVEEYRGQSPLGSIEALTLRLYDAASGRWSLYWATSEKGLVTTPNVGAFAADGVGDFLAREVYDGRPIVSRYRWTPLDPRTCRWEQSFSTDDAVTWELNWVMEFTRATR